jgi:hypothetical protein
MSEEYGSPMLLPILMFKPSVTNILLGFKSLKRKHSKI